MVTKFEHCIARPSEGNKNYPLTEHLFAVAYGMGSPDGTYQEQLWFLAGLLHDVGKAREAWQQYIRNPSSGKQVRHSVVGAIIFAYTADALLSMSKEVDINDKQILYWEMVRAIRDVLDHHGRLKDIEKQLPWEGESVNLHLADMDLPGINHWLINYHPVFRHIDFSVKAIQVWNKGFHDKWEQTAIRSPRLLRNQLITDIPLLALRTQTAALIASDRLHAAKIEENHLTEDMATDGTSKLAAKIAGKQKTSDESSPSEIQHMRQFFQEEAIARYEQSDNLIHLLRLPTGMGKTYTSLKIALRACQTKGKKRIIYVAPYLTILSQATGEIRDVTGLEVMQHHSLMWAEDKEWDDRLELTVEAWKVPIITTTFQQLYQGFFPQKAQQTIRLSGLRDAVLLIDEPQVMNYHRWCLFLRFIDVAVRKMGTEVIFISATPPPFLTLGSPIHHLADMEKSYYQPRFRVYFIKERWSEVELVNHVINTLKENRSTAIIVNSIKDSMIVFNKLNEQIKANELPHHIVYLNGMMTPLHKAKQVTRIQKWLKAREEEITSEANKVPLVVVSTQVIEAGVDLSFDVIYRALPIYPSIVQTAGRVNRHGSQGEGKLYVFRYFREGKTETRQFVYREAKTRQITDELLERITELDEQGLLALMDEYFLRLSEEVSVDEMQKIREAAQGKWSSLAGIQPFDESDKRVPVFVPWLDEQYNTEVLIVIQKEMAKWGIHGLDGWYEHYADSNWINQLSMLERKQFLGILQLFLVPLPRELAPKVITGWNNFHSIQQSVGLHKYSNDSGFAGLFIDKDGHDVI